jgi:putative copper export protein
MRWRPRLSVAAGGDETKAEPAERWICWNAGAELVIGGIIIVIVAVLGLLPPPAP